MKFYTKSARIVTSALLVLFRRSEKNRNTKFDTESHTSLKVFIYFALHNSSNCATLNQLCIQAHSSSLRCGGSLCKVQGD